MTMNNRRGLSSNATVLVVALVVGTACVLMVMDKKSRERSAPLEQPSTVEATQTESAEAASTRGETEPNNTPTEVASAPAEFESESVRTALGLVPTITRIPVTDAELSAAYDRSSLFTCALVPAGNSLEVTSFTPFLLVSDRKKAGNQTPPPSLRRHVLSVGLSVGREDQESLPMLTSRMVLSYLRDHYVSIQARVVKDPTTLVQYLHPEPMAATAKCQGSYMTTNTEPSVLEAIKDFRGIGLLVKPGEEPKPQTLRTLVLVQKYDKLDAGDARPKVQFEVVLIRARDRGNDLVLHTFVTSDSRQALHYLGENRKPRQVSDCNIQADVTFREYTHASLVPASGVVRQSKVDGQRRFGLDDLKGYVESHQLEGDVWANVVTVLDAVIDRRL